MPGSIIARASTVIEADAARVWEALVSPHLIARYMFGAQIESTWREGAPIVWRGEWKGKAFEDRGVILRLEPGRLFRYTHYSPLSGTPDVPENYHTVNIELTGEGGRTTVRLTQDNNASEDAREHSEANWRAMLAGLRSVVQGAGQGPSATP